MSEFNHQPPPGDVFDRAAAAVRGQAIPAPPAELSAAISAAVSNRLQLAEASARRRRWIVRGMSVGGLAACLAVAVTWGGGRAYALDPVIQRMKAAESARFTVVQTLGDQKPMTQKFWVRGDQVRGEFADAATVIVTDVKQRKGLLTIPALKQYQRLPRPGAQIEVGDGRTPLDQFLAIRDAKAERLGQEQVGGVLADKLKVERPAANGYHASTWTVWLDPATTLPVKIVSAGTAVTGDKTVPAESVFTDFAWNEKFADSLFTLDPPDGYADGAMAARPVREKSHPVRLLVALDNQEKVKSFRAVIKTTLVDPPAGMPAMPEQRMFQQGGRVRIEAGDTVSVGDAGRVVLFDHKAKTAKTATVAGVMKSDPVKGVTDGVRKMLAARGDGTAVAVPAVEVRGKKRPGFRVDGVCFGPGQTADVTYYIDEERALPLRWEIAMTGPVKVTAVGEYLAFDEELDPKLFSLDIPAGYAVEELKLPAPAKGEKPAPPPGPVSLRRAAGLLSAAPCVVVRHVQRQDPFRTSTRTLAVRGRLVRIDHENSGRLSDADPKTVPVLETDVWEAGHRPVRPDRP